MKFENKITVIFPLILFLIFNTQIAFGKTCILSLLGKSSKEAKILDSVFNFYAEADYFKQAQVQDIKNCFNSGLYDEILWVSHGSSLKDGLSNYSSPVLVKSDGSKLILPKRFFELLSQQTTYSSIKKVRFNLCGLDFSKADNKIHSSIDPFIKGLELEKIEIDISPRFSFGSYLLKEDVTRIDRNWLSKSIDPDSAQKFVIWSTKENTHCKEDFWPGCDRQAAKQVIPLSFERVR